MFRHDYPDKDLLTITPGPHDALLFERSFLSYQDRVHLLRAGYLSVVTLVCESYETLQALFARHGIVLERIRFNDRAMSRIAQLDRIVAASSPFPQRPVKDVKIGLEHTHAVLSQGKYRETG
jgi:hypothetical protein